MKQYLFAITMLTLVSWTHSNLAQSPGSVIPDQQGDYFSNLGYHQGTVASGKLQAGHLWTVVSPSLSCRTDASLKSKTIRQFKQGEVLQADVGRGGSDEVLQNAEAADGKPWMRVRSAKGQNYNCYVRANRKYIQPK